MQCPKCGWENPAEATSCSNCATELTTPIGQPQPTQQIPQSQQLSQPYVMGGAQTVPTFMTWSIIVAVLSALMCNVASLVLGIIAIVKSSSANTRNGSGDMVGAAADANTAKILNTVGTVLLALGLLVVLLMIGLLIGIPFLTGIIGGLRAFGSAPH